MKTLKNAVKIEIDNMTIFITEDAPKNIVAMLRKTIVSKMREP